MNNTTSLDAARWLAANTELHRAETRTNCPDGMCYCILEVKYQNETYATTGRGSSEQAAIQAAARAVYSQIHGKGQPKTQKPDL